MSLPFVVIEWAQEEYFANNDVLGVLDVEVDFLPNHNQ